MCYMMGMNALLHFTFASDNIFKNNIIFCCYSHFYSYICIQYIVVVYLVIVNGVLVAPFLLKSYDRNKSIVRRADTGYIFCVCLE